MKYFKERVLKYFMKFLNILKWNISSCIPSSTPSIIWYTVSWWSLQRCALRNKFQKSYKFSNFTNTDTVSGDL